MVLLDDLLARFETSSFAEETALALGDLHLSARMPQADAESLSLGAFAQGAMRRFAAEASDEDGVTLLGSVPQHALRIWGGVSEVRFQAGGRAETVPYRK